MPYPIRFKLIHKETRQTFKEWAKTNGKTNAGDRHGSPFQLMLCINEDGVPGYVNYEGFYLGHYFLKPAEWELHMATHKEDGKWVYQQVGA